MCIRDSIVLLVLRVLVLAFRFFLTVQQRQLLLKLVELHAELTADGDEAAEAVYVVLMLLVNLFVDLERLVEEVHAPVAARDHELPLDLLRLDLARPFEILDRLLKHVLLRVVHPQTRDHVDLRRVVPEALLVEVHCLELVLLLLVEVAHLGEDL